MALGFLTNIFHLSLKHSQFPSIWKSSLIIPLLKAGKPAEDLTSYRPVSLLCPAIKIMEGLILPTLDEHLHVPDIQHGFRKQHSTVTALHDFNQNISRGFCKKKPPERTVLLQLDLSKAFDMVNHDKLLKGLEHSSLPAEIKRWFNTYLRGRQSRVNFLEKHRRQGMDRCPPRCRHLTKALQLLYGNDPRPPARCTASTICR